MLLGKNVRLLSQKTRQLAKRSARSARQTEIGRVSLSLPEIFVVFMYMYMRATHAQNGTFACPLSRFFLTQKIDGFVNVFGIGVSKPVYMTVLRTILFFAFFGTIRNNMLSVGHLTLVRITN